MQGHGLVLLRRHLLLAATSKSVKIELLVG
jgi:hypothetical protein